MAYLIALSEGYEHDSDPDVEDLEELRDFLDTEADAWLLDFDGRNTGVMSQYCEEEPTGDCEASVTVVIDQQMRIRYIGGTHVPDGTEGLDELLELF